MPEINTDAVFEKLSKQNGEKFARVIRGDEDHGEDLCSVPGIVHMLEFAGRNNDDAKQIRKYIEYMYNKHEKSQYYTDKNPLELLSDAGYDAFFVTNEEQKNSIKKYFRPKEELCTFGDPTRHENYYIIHAVKRGADKIKPAENPQRQDEYGTSVISIQIAKTDPFISIKNRYNHTVNNPDATFGNNPDNIIPGLTNSLKQFFNVDFDITESLLPDDFCVINGQIFKCNYRMFYSNLFGRLKGGYCGYGNGFYFYGDNVTKLNRDYEITLDNYVLNVRDGTLKDVINDLDAAESNEWSKYQYKCKEENRALLENFFKGKKLKITINPENKHEKIIFMDGVWAVKVVDGKMQELNLPNIKEVGDCFLSDAKYVTKLYMPDLEKAGKGFFYYCYKAREAHLPKLKIVDILFMHYCYELTLLVAPVLERCRGGFLENSRSLTELRLPELQYIERDFVQNNLVLRRLDLPKLKNIPEWFLIKNDVLEFYNLPSVQKSDRKKLRHVRYVVAKNKLKAGLRKVFLPRKAQSYTK